MSFWNSIKNFKNKIEQVEHSVYSGKDSLMEIYERNIKLEAEIRLRTKELDTANKQMLTLQHILNMMNSSKPLSSVLSAVVNNLQGELGYLHSCIVKKNKDEKGDYLQILACSGDLTLDIENHFKVEVQDLRLDFAKSIEQLTTNDGEIYSSSDVRTLLLETVPKLTQELVDRVLQTTSVKSYILIPLIYKKARFGSLVVFSSREKANQNELDFLNLFAKQIELAITIADLFQAVKEQAITDGMTGLYNRRYFEEYIKKEAIRADRQHQRFTIIGLDLDHLKEINDVYGHNYGDLAIKSIAEVLKKSSRSIDISARMGGEEFNVILPGVDSQGGMIVAERIRKGIEDLELEKIGKITASLGVATYFEHSDDIDELLELVDQAMYESKHNGRNRVTLAKPMNEISWQEVAIKTFADIIAKHRIPLNNNTKKLINEKLEQMNHNNDMLYQISDILTSTYNPEHADGVTKKKVLLATTLAKRFDLSKANIDNLKIAVLMYDIGNTMLPHALLSKKAPLTEEDKQSIKQHPLIAAREILEPITDIVDVIPIIEKHHENWNGSGYPNKLSGNNIPIESQIILIVDSYYALIEKRPYRPAMSKEKAIETIMNESEQKWSKKLAQEFAKIVELDL